MTGTKPRRKRHLTRFTCYIGGVVELYRVAGSRRLAWIAVRQWDGLGGSAVITPSMARRLAASLDVFADDGDPLSPAAARAKEYR